MARTSLGSNIVWIAAHGLAKFPTTASYVFAKAAHFGVSVIFLRKKMVFDRHPYNIVPEQTSCKKVFLPLRQVAKYIFILLKKTA
jgi:hypothetical protein